MKLKLTGLLGFLNYSKMMATEKPDFAQLGITSKMLGYSTPPPPEPSSPSSPVEQTQSDDIGQQDLPENGDEKS